MKPIFKIGLLLAGLATGAAALAQACGSGGGATVCLSAAGSSANVQLNWTLTGSTTRLEVYRDTDSNPSGRTRLATVSTSTRSYTDTSAVAGTPYWYWVKFTAGGTGYNSGAATATRSGGSGCSASTVAPFVRVGSGSYTAGAAVTAAAGTTVGFGPQPASGGSWAWSGCGTSGSAREQSFTAKASCTASVTYTNSCGARSTQAFSLTVPGMRDLDSVALSRLMGAGWNLGNSLEAIGGETAWGNPATTQALIDAVKAAGFKSIRIPVSWKQYADANDNISATWMARVTQVVNHARSAGLYTIINVHWDGGWMQPTYAQQAAVNARLTKFWTQIANNFKGYDDTLLFAGTNEVMKEGDYGTPTVEYYTVQNSFNQTFVNAVRATGGNNLARHLVVQGFNTNIDHTVNFATIPSDSVSRRLMMEVHFYDPYNFTLNETSNAIWQWGAGATNSAATESWAHEAWVDAQFNKMKSRFIEQGVAVVLGEFGVISRTDVAGSETYRNAWNQYVARSAWTRGLVPIYWDNGVTGNHGMGLFNRSSGAQAYPVLIGIIVNAAR